MLEPSSDSLRSVYATENSAPNLPSREGIADQERGARIGLLGEIVVAELNGAGDRESVVVERPPGAQIDGRAERAFLDLGRGRLAHGDVVEQLGREDVEVEVAAAVGAAGGVGAAVGAHRFDAVDAHARELRAETAHGDLPAFTRIAGDDDAGHALQRFGEVQVREIGDVFGDDHVDRADLALLGVERLVEAGAETGYHDFFELPRRRPRLRHSAATAALATLNSAVAIASLTAREICVFFPAD